MANLVTEGFDWFPTGQGSTVREQLWGANNFFETDPSINADVTAGRFSGQALLFHNTNTTFLPVNGVAYGYVIPIGATPQTGFVGFAHYVYPDQAGVLVSCVQIFDAVNNVPQVVIEFCANGVVKVWAGAGYGITPTTLLAASAAGSFQEDQWFHCEIKATVANSGGAVEVRINTVPVIQLVGADTQNSSNAYFDSVLIGNASRVNTATWHNAWDDLFVNDTTGTKNNNWSGNLRVKTQFMIANGFTNNFSIGGTAPAATNWQSVLNNNMDDTKFVYSSTVGNIDLYTPDPNLNSPLVRSLQVRMGLRQDDATQRMAHAMLRIGGVNYEGSVDQYTNQTFTFYKERFETNPATAVDFTGADVNGLQAGVKLVA